MGEIIISFRKLYLTVHSGDRDSFPVSTVNRTPAQQVDMPP